MTYPSKSTVQGLVVFAFFFGLSWLVYLLSQSGRVTGGILAAIFLFTILGGIERTALGIAKLWGGDENNRNTALRSQERSVIKEGAAHESNADVASDGE